MNYVLPITLKYIEDELYGKTMALADYDIITKQIKVQYVEFKEDETWKEDCEFSIKDGVLNLYEKQTLKYRFNGFATENDIVFLYGENYNSISKHGKLQSIIYEPQYLNNDFDIYVYSENQDKLQHLLNSFNKDDIQSSQVQIVNTQSWKEFSIIHSFVTGEHTDKRYIITLPGNCEIMNGFIEALNNIDVGLNQDLILFSKNPYFGLWSSTFLQRLQENCSSDYKSVSEFKQSIFEHINVFRDMNNFTQKRSRDVYNTGSKQTVYKSNVLPIKLYL